MSIDVRRCGARGDGITDDAPAFRRALAAARDGRDAVLVPDGRYALAEDPDQPFSCLDLPSGVSLQGTGTLLYASGVRASVRLIRVANPTVTIRGLGLDLSAAPVGTSFGISVQPGARDVDLVDLALLGNPNRGGVQIIGGHGIALRRCQILNMAQNGVTLYGDGPGNGPVGVSIEFCHVTSAVQPIDCEPVNGAVCRDLSIRSCHLVCLNDNYALTLSGSRDSTVRDCSLRGALYLSGAVKSWIAGNIVDATRSIRHDAVVAFGKTGWCRIEANVIRAAPDLHGIHVARRSSGSPRRLVIRANSIAVQGATSAGVLIKDAVHTRLSGNRIVGDGAAGIRIRVPTVAARRTIGLTRNDVHGFSAPVDVRVGRS